MPAAIGGAIRSEPQVRHDMTPTAQQETDAQKHRAAFKIAILRLRDYGIWRAPFAFYQLS